MKIAIVLAGLLLIGCSSAPKVSAKKPQYCYTSQTIETQNGERVNSKTRVECTDDQIKRLTASRAGFSPYCGEFTYWMRIGGKDVQRKGISCQKPDGSWEVIDVVGR
jgi:outer membrane murein-binding lipoprotein Lpp